MIINKIVLLGIIAVAFYKYVWPIVRIFVEGNVRLDKSSTIGDEEYKKLAIGAPYASQQGAYQNILGCGIGQKTFTIANEWWGVSDGDSAREALDALIKEGSRSLLPAVLEAMDIQDPDARSEFLKSKISDEDNFEKAWSYTSNLKDCLDELKEDKVIEDAGDIKKYGSSGWDYGRIVFLARVCFSAGYLPEAETWEYIDKASKMARKEFKSWDKFGKSYVIGRAMWGGKDSNNSGIAMIVSSLLTDQNSPWVKLAW